MSIATYIVHYTGLKERKRNLDKYEAIESTEPRYVTEKEVIEEKVRIKHISDAKHIFNQVDSILHLLRQIYLRYQEGGILRMPRV